MHSDQFMMERGERIGPGNITSIFVGRYQCQIIGNFELILGTHHILLQNRQMMYT